MDQGDLISKLITTITHIVAPVILFNKLFTKSPDPPSGNYISVGLN